MRCSLCGLEFDEKKAQTACSSCPLAGSCGLVRCPACGFEMPREPVWFEKIRAWHDRRRRNRRGGGHGRAFHRRNQAEQCCARQRTISLTDLKKGMHARIVSLGNRDNNSNAALVSFGALPGVLIELVQKYPAFVVKIGESVFAIDRELAGLIHVQIA